MTTTGTWIYPSTFRNSIGTAPTYTDNLTPPTSTIGNAYDGQLASFIFLVAGLEKNLRDSSPILFDTNTSFANPRVPLGSGHSFTVERAEWKSRSSIGLETSRSSKWGKFVALKYVRRVQNSAELTRWKEILLEIRALLHEPIRYHPNIVRLLGLSWGAAQGTRSVFPVLALEYAEFGSLNNLQTNLDPLPFKVKKKLCHDVSKGLSILHACGIVHGDLKHENVLVYRNKDQEAEIIYTAKLADFGGSVMDLVEGDQRSLHMGTPPFNAPEFHNRLDAEDLKLTDVYSLGLLVWRTVLDGKNPFDLSDFASLTPGQVEDLKLLDLLLPIAKESVRTHTTLVTDTDIEVLDFAFQNTIQAVSKDRSLARTVAAFQAAELSEIPSLLKAADNANEEERKQEMERIPGSHGITPDSLGVFIAKSSYGDYDFQCKGPGHRPKLPTPDPVEFLFEPLRLKLILDWSLQRDMVHDLEHAAVALPGASTTQIPRVKVSFALFQCYIHEFGVTFDAERACHWLRMAAESDDQCVENYLAQAWCWRIHRALGVILDVEMSTLRNWMLVSIVRGHRKCIAESLTISSLIADSDEKKLWTDGVRARTSVLRTVTGGVGMPYFLSHKLRRQYDLSDLDTLDENIQTEYSFRGVDSLDKVFVNHRGDGLLHMAASLGKLSALKHLVEKYKPDIDVANQADSETPLLCACRGGHLDCAIFLLDSGANPQGSQFANETPLNWLCSFAEDDIPTIAKKLCTAGASLKKHRDYRLQPRSTWSDPEYLFTLPVSPLSRAVVMESFPAVKTLLALGADPLEEISTFTSTCPVVLAAVLTLPRILEVLLRYIDTTTQETTRIFTDMEMLHVAADKIATVVDTSSLQSRLSRCGKEYKSAMFETLEALCLRDKKATRWETEGNEHRVSAENTMLARMVSLGNVDIVDSLLRLGHSVHGKPDASPIVEAVKLNHEAIFRLLIGHGADVLLKISAPSSGQQSLLQLSADRPSQSRPGLFIPEYLLRMGVPVDPLPDGSRSAFASAVRNQDFALADLLLCHGADVDFQYMNGPHWTTVFGELIRTPTEKNVESIKYLLGINRPTIPSNFPLPPTLLANEEAVSLTPNCPLPNFIVDKVNNFSVLHLAAIHVPHSDSEALILGQMVVLVLSEGKYCAEETINLRHPALGTALWAATRWGNLEVVSALLEKRANPNIPFKDVTPLGLASQAIETVGQTNDGKLDRAARQEQLKRYMLIVELLRSAGAQ